MNEKLVSMDRILQLFLLFNWDDFLLGQRDWQFVLMVIIRTVIMFLVIVIGLRLLGKRGVSQLSVFELGVIVGLGSAAGDPMFYKSVGVLFCILVFVIIIAMYHLMKFALGKSDRLDKFVEGNPVDVVCEGEIKLDQLRKEPLTKEELFSQLRSQGISHLGQIKQAILEPSGQISIFYFADDEVRYGLPTIPQHLKHPFKEIPQVDCYSCVYCGHTMIIDAREEQECPVCKHHKWVKAGNEKRLR